MAKSRFDTSFDFGANVAARKATSGTKKSKGGKRKLTAAQKYTAALYMTSRRRSQAVLFTTPDPLTFTTGFPGLPSSQRPGAEDFRRRAREFKAGLRRKAQLRKAAEILPHLPGPGESLHTLLTGYFDFALVLTCVLRSRHAPCEHARVATLSFGPKNTQEMARWLDEKLVGRLSLLCADFMAKANPKVYQGAVKELVEQRGQVVGSARCHAKVVTLAFADGMRLA